ncbi:MAG: hypothetical protein VKL60_16785 [Sphaerospermopsis sp.]|nr:hypothetical protein [Sphaerospermopsis sp.]
MSQPKTSVYPPKSFIRFSSILLSAFLFLGLVQLNKNHAQAFASLPKSSVLLAQSSNKSVKYQILSGTTSPNQKYAVAWGIPGRKGNSPSIEADDDLDKVENYLVDLKTKRIISKLENCQYFPQQNPGDIIAKWSSNSQSVLFAHERKWEPQAIALANVNGVQVNVLKKLVQDTRYYLSKNDNVAYQANKNKVVIDLDNNSTNPLQFTNNRLVLPVAIYIPKAENGYERYLSVSYQVRTLKNRLTLKLLDIKKRVN